METYVARVLAGEAVRDSQPAALEALAITIRTFALANRGRHRADGFDLCDQTHCQVLRDGDRRDRARGAGDGRPAAAARRRAGVDLLLRVVRRPHAAAVRRLARRRGSAVPAVEGRRCVSGRAGVDGGAARERSAARAAGVRVPRRRCATCSIASRNASGRVARLKLDGLKPDQISGQDLRVAVGRTLGWQHVKSTAFDLRKKDGSYRFSGHGSGHGVGMCVIGSARLAERGVSAEDILARYFPGLADLTGADDGSDPGQTRV